MKPWLTSNRRDLGIVTAVMTGLFVLRIVAWRNVIGDVIVAVAVLAGGGAMLRTVRNRDPD